MTEDAYNAIVQEIENVQDENKTRHEIWSQVAREYQIDNIGSLRDLIGSSYITNSISDSVIAKSRVPHLHLYVNKMLASITARNPDFVLKPRKQNTEAIAGILEFAFGQQARDINLEWVLEKSGRNTLLFGTGITKIGYSSSMVYGEIAASDTRLPKGAGRDADEIGKQYKNEPFSPMTEHGDIRDWGQPSAIPIRTWDYFPSSGARSDAELRREYVRYRRRVLDVKKDVRFKAGAREEISGYTLIVGTNERDMDIPMNLVDDVSVDNTLWCDLWEVVDIPSQQSCIVCSECTEPLRDWSPLGLPAGVRSPYVKERMVDNADGFWGVSYGALLLPACQALDLLNAIVISQIGRDGKRILFYDSDLSPNAEMFQGQIQNAKDLEAIPLPGLASLQGEPYRIIPVGGANPELLRLVGIFKGNLDFVSQLTDQARGATSATEQTATEVNIRSQNQMMGVSAYRSRHEQASKEIARGLCKIMLKEWPQEKMVKVTGNDPRVFFWIPLERARVQDDFDIDIVVGSTEMPDKAVTRRQLTEAMPMIIQLTQMIQQDQQMQQQGQPPGPTNPQGILELYLDQFDVSFKNKVLRQKDPVRMVVDLLKNHGFPPEMLSMSAALDTQVKNYIRAQAMGVNMAFGAPGMPMQSDEQNGMMANPPNSAGSQTDLPGTPSATTLSQGANN